MNDPALHDLFEIVHVLDQSQSCPGPEHRSGHHGSPQAENRNTINEDLTAFDK